MGDNEGKESIFEAARAGHVDRMQEILAESDVDVNASGQIGDAKATALVWASRCGHADVVQLLLAYDNIQVNGSENDSTSALHVAVENGHVDVVRLLVASPHINVNQMDKDGVATALHWAAEHGNIEIVQLLVDCDGIDVNRSTIYSKSALYLASEKGHDHVVRVLLACNNINVNLAVSYAGTALHAAIENGHLDVVELLMACCSIELNLVPTHEKSVLHLAIEKGHVGVAHALASAPAMNVNLVDKCGWSALHLAAQIGDSKLVSLLVQRNDVDLNRVDKHGRSALHIAHGKGYDEIVRALENHVGIQTSLLDVHGLTAAEYARIGAKVQVVRSFDAFLEAIKRGFTTLAAGLVHQGHVDVNEMGRHAAETYAKRFHFLTQKMEPFAASKSFAPKEGSALMWAIRFGCVDLVQLILSRDDLDINCTSKTNHESALHWAIEFNNLDIITALLSCKDLDLNLEDEADTALHIAVEKGHDDVARALISCERFDIFNGAYPVVDCVMQHERYEILNCLWESGYINIDRIYNKDKTKLLLECMAAYLSGKSALKLLMLDLPLTLNDDHLLPRQDHAFSWAAFLDVTVPIPQEVRLSCIKSILARETKSSCSKELLHELAFAKDKHGRDVLQITDEVTRSYFHDLLFFCGRYQIFEGPPIHVSNTSAVVMAYDHGICAQVFSKFANSKGELDKNGFVKSSQLLGRIRTEHKFSKQRNARDSESWKAEFSLWDKTRNGYMSEKEFLRYCAQDEFNREIHTRTTLKSNIVLQALPALDQTVFQEHLPMLIINEDVSMAEYNHVIIMPAADRSLDDIYLKERPDENKTKCLLRDVAAGLLFMHDRGFVHGDVKKLNVLRCQDQLKLIDFDAAVRVGESMGGKYSSGVLPPEMFFELETDDMITKYNDYFRIEKAVFPKLQKAQFNKYVVKSHCRDRDPSTLPYSLIKASPAIDIWSFGCMMYQMLSSAELIPTDINQNVVANHLKTAATWTHEKLRQRIETFIPNEVAQDLVLRLLQVDPRDRISMKEVLEHPYFTGVVQFSGVEILQNLENTQNEILATLEKVTELERIQHKHVEEVAEGTQAALSTLKRDVVTGLVDVHDLDVPTSFVVLPCKLNVDVNASKILSFITHLCTTGKALLDSVSKIGISAALAQLNLGEPMYFYLIDERDGAVVIPELADKVYPIEIATQDGSSFLLMNLPFIENGFKSLMKVNSPTHWLQRLHLLPSTPSTTTAKERVSNVVQEANRAMEMLSIPTISFEAFGNVLNVEEPTTYIRTASRELERFYEKHDPAHSFAGLQRVIDDKGNMLWTSMDRVLYQQCDCRAGGGNP
ncbi:Aste57867_14735 [Aphanomyces stellatus]|uniref:Aste57867_14735 protein n=1 Tax=Aphanomyces stellatus TaxID=120398 RepID=A0A485L2E3_9STRA|nr:hypothetical protein As57867_014680 [Aphanomyces stellatus]VFT91553.1 Aste57867_14735 [Aphanomyces stellatus]